MRRFSKYVLIFSLLLSATVAWAVPVTQQIPFTKTTTLAVPDTYTFRFSLWDIATGGTAGANRAWWEIKDIAMTTKTLTTNLGSVANTAKRSGPLADVDFSEQYWVQFEKLEANGKTWTVVGKRTKFNIVPYAMWSAQGGDSVSVNPGNGLTGTTGPEGDITLNVGAGDGISVGADTVSVKAGGINNTMLADGAVTDTKITGPISAAKIDTTGLNSVYVNVSGDTMTGTLNLPLNGLVAGTNQLVLTGGSVGIGTTTPTAKLHVENATGTTGIWATTTYANGAGVRGVANSGVLAAGIAGVSGEGVGVSGLGGTYGGYFRGPKTYVEGNLGVGTLDPGAYKLYVSGNAYTTGTWGSSDIRWKKNIATLESSLEKVLQLRGVSYDWKTEEYPDKGFTEGRQIGFIAQEVEPILPEVVKTDSDGYKALAYDKIAAVLVEAMKEQQSQIEALKARIEALENR